MGDPVKILKYLAAFAAGVGGTIIVFRPHKPVAPLNAGKVEYLVTSGDLLAIGIGEHGTHKYLSIPRTNPGYDELLDSDFFEPCDSVVVTDGQRVLFSASR